MTLKSASPMAVYIPKLFNNSYLNTDKFNKPSFYSNFVRQDKEAIMLF